MSLAHGQGPRLAPGSAGENAGFERTAYTRIVLLILALVLTGTLVAGFTGLPLFQDGSWYLAQIIFGGGPTTPHGRLPAALVQVPAVLLLNSEAEPAQVRLGFTLSYALVPFLTLTSCWLVVRRPAPIAFVWPALGIICLNVVNFSGVSEQIIAAQVGWILLLVALHRRDRMSWRIFLLLGALTAVLLHKLGGPPLVLVAMVLLFLRRSFGSTLVAVAMIALSVAAPLLFFYFPSAYEANLHDQRVLLRYLFRATPAEWSWVSSIVAFGMTVVVSRRLPKDSAPWLHALPLLGAGLVLVAGMWLASELLVVKAGLKCGPSYLAQLALMGLAIIDARSPLRPEAGARAVGVGLCLIVACSSAITVEKAWLWSRATARLEATLSESTEGCVEVTSPRFGWIRHAPDSMIHTWALPSTALHYQEAPRTLLLMDGDCAHLRKTGFARLMRHRPLRKARLQQSFGPLR